MNVMLIVTVAQSISLISAEPPLGETPSPHALIVQEMEVPPLPEGLRRPLRLEFGKPRHETISTRSDIGAAVPARPRGRAMVSNDPALLRYGASEWREASRLRWSVDQGPVRVGLWADVREIGNLANYESGPPPAGMLDGPKPAVPARPAALDVSSGLLRGESGDLSYTEYRGGMFMAAPF
jgi:hypothetical protein